MYFIDFIKTVEDNGLEKLFIPKEGASSTMLLGNSKGNEEH